MRKAVLLSAILAVAGALATGVQASPAYGPNLEQFPYPFPVERFEFDSQGQRLSMAYMDVKPERPNGRTVLLLHGKNFCGATWEGTIRPLAAAGYRVVVPDQVGFCKSTKPAHYQYSFHQLAANTRALADRLGIGRVTVMGHSMGGMLAMRYALVHPDGLDGLVLVNPIGLEDWKAEGVPYQSVDSWYQSELKTSAEGIRAYQKATYYSGEWRPEYDRWVEMLAGMYRGEGRELVAWNQALTYDMVYTQPVVHELEKIRVPTLLLIGERDNTAIGKALAPPEVQKRLGNYAELGPRTASRIPNATLVRFPELGHSPQIQQPARFNAALLEGLERLGAR
ncbi:alpha/beta hydrolase [Azospirillum sp. SYSU D00513]|uniref:alpha/beta fold hydrolase n=1 Tax=Azospirillum sp. SYSU D00513 TaxID=2812561 RepID=UPI001A9621DF|nr:alpha/beta hydrolase [Azospirillum sp. SYSU D00513]